jgi:hypothetical protein
LVVIVLTTTALRVAPLVVMFAPEM